jgi:N-formylglutamate deformylase
MQAFEDGSLPAASFHHADHVKMAFLHLQKYPPLEALSRFSSSLVRFAKANGKPYLYNETITWAFLLLIRERLARAGSSQTWAGFSAANPDLLRWEDNVLKKYYRQETLASDLAKSVFLFPDKP